MDATLLARLESVTNAAVAEAKALEAKTKQFPDGCKYVGEFHIEGNLKTPHGYGEFYKPGGILQYSGEFYHGYMHGKGIFTFDNGDEWEGTFCKDQLHGWGKYTPYIDANELRKKRKKKKNDASNGEAESRKKPHNVIYWRGRKVCNVSQILFSRIKIKLEGRQWLGLVTAEKDLRSGRKKYLLTLDDDPQHPTWYNLELYEFQIFPARGKIYSIGCEDTRET